MTITSLQSTLLYLVLFLSCKIDAYLDEEWKSATATYIKDMEGSDLAEGACGHGDLHKVDYRKYSASLSTILFNKRSTCGACYKIKCVVPAVVTATDSCAPNYGLSSNYGGWCNFPREYFEMTKNCIC